MFTLEINLTDVGLMLGDLHTNETINNHYSVHSSKNYAILKFLTLELSFYLSDNRFSSFLSSPYIPNGKEKIPVLPNEICEDFMRRNIYYVDNTDELLDYKLLFVNKEFNDIFDITITENV